MPDSVVRNPDGLEPRHGQRINRNTYGIHKYQLSMPWIIANLDTMQPNIGFHICFSRRHKVLLPPCQQGKHGSYLDSDGRHATKPIGKYYFTEDALKHDLAALKRGDIYDKHEFYTRAKAWYKAEIDRLVHLARVKEENSPDDNKQPEPNPPVTAPTRTSITNPRSPTHPRTTPKPKPETTPTRIQPTRAAKRKAAPEQSPAHRSTDPPTKKRQRRNPPPAPIRITPTANNPAHPDPDPDPVPPHDPHAGRSLADAETLTRGDYTLAALDWAQFVNGNQGELHRPARRGADAQGLDVAYFCRVKAGSRAADGAGRRGEVDRNVGQAPEAEMEISPTLGRWPAHVKSISSDSQGEGGLVEDLARNVVAVSGLKFAVDLCASSAGAEEDVRFLML
ncbi:hypothetical protein BT67DRAFT_456517 [Trichocladium antarcticum]|uniref:Uncharacterized protein n=1 Tax=Trichocladium antarcticum TaxID=1450529 RepID=A0AAN6UIQ1_9PEZI|nr:hypothetical protein BT67DRAFT_456517 [Trichocladium antarcticum]